MSFALPPEGHETRFVSAAWCQQLPMFRFDTSLTADGRQIAEQETRPFLEAIWRLVPWRWINAPNAVRRGSNKMLQLRVASACGFPIPPTYVGNDPVLIRQFHERFDHDVIIKDLDLPVLELADGPYYSFTTRLATQALEQLDGLRFAPVCLQQHVKKRYELRVTVVGNRVFAARIDSQASSETAMDYRRGELWSKPERYAATAIPDAVAARCRSVVHALDLDYGAVDLIVDPDDRYVFLEVNSTGAWIWIQGLTGLHITEAIADLLIAQADGHYARVGAT